MDEYLSDTPTVGSLIGMWSTLIMCHETDSVTIPLVSTLLDSIVLMWSQRILMIAHADGSYEFINHGVVFPGETSDLVFPEIQRRCLHP